MSKPITSLMAFFAKKDKTEPDHKSIANALGKISEGTYEDIARVMRISDLNVVSRRLKEMENRNIVEKTGKMSLTTRNRKANNYRLCHEK